MINNFKKILCRYSHFNNFKFVKYIDNVEKRKKNILEKLTILSIKSMRDMNFNKRIKILRNVVSTFENFEIDIFRKRENRNRDLISYSLLLFIDNNNNMLFMKKELIYKELINVINSLIRFFWLKKIKREIVIIVAKYIN